MTRRAYLQHCPACGQETLVVTLGHGLIRVDVLEPRTNDQGEGWAAFAHHGRTCPKNPTEWKVDAVRWPEGLEPYHDMVVVPY